MANERRRRQIARRIQAKLAQLLLYEMKDPRASFVTITEVDVNADLTLAKIYWSALNPSARARTESLLKHAHGFLRTEVAHDLQLRTAPQLDFRFDERVERAERLESILREVLPPSEGEAADDEDGEASAPGDESSEAPAPDADPRRPGGDD